MFVSNSGIVFRLLGHNSILKSYRLLVNWGRALRMSENRLIHYKLLSEADSRSEVVIS